MPVVHSIYRYPIKGLSPQSLTGVVLEEGRPFPFDRVFALTRPGSAPVTSAARWAKKGLFLMLMLEDALACVRTHLDVETMQLTVRRAGAGDAAAPMLDVNLRETEGCRAVEAFFSRQVPGLASAPTLVQSRDGHFMDKPENVISCINLATVRSLEQRLGYPVHPLRFRANFYLEGVPPWEEFDWIGGDLALGGVTFQVDRRNGRCGAVNVNPETGARDLDLPAALRAAYGHKDLGVYLIARNGGQVAVGDRVVVPQGAASPRRAAAFVPPAPEQVAFICRGCYYIYEESKGAPGLGAGTVFADIPGDWRCPDCGTEKGNFRRYVTPAPSTAIRTNPA
ncbi:MAG TPA: rubredoxin [Polyangia bacterium]